MSEVDIKGNFGTIYKITKAIFRYFFKALAWFAFQIFRLFEYAETKCE